MKDSIKGLNENTEAGTVSAGIAALSFTMLVPVVIDQFHTHVSTISAALVVGGLSCAYLIKDTELGQTQVYDYFFGTKHSQELASQEIINDGHEYQIS